MPTLYVLFIGVMGVMTASRMVTLHVFFIGAMCIMMCFLNGVMGVMIV